MTDFFQFFGHFLRENWHWLTMMVGLGSVILYQLSNRRSRFPADYPKPFYVWAFGDLESALRVGKMSEWNRRHGDLLLLKPDDKIYVSLEKMYKLYLESKNKSQREE